MKYIVLMLQFWFHLHIIGRFTPEVKLKAGKAHVTLLGNIGAFGLFSGGGSWAWFVWASCFFQTSLIGWDYPLTGIIVAPRRAGTLPAGS